MQDIRQLLKETKDFMMDAPEAASFSLAFNAHLKRQCQQLLAQKFVEMEDDTGHLQEAINAMTEIQLQEMAVTVHVILKLVSSAFKEENKTEMFVPKFVVQGLMIIKAILVMTITILMETAVLLIASLSKGGPAQEELHW